jgi:tetratricopeptide (TPR) repeat protein
VNDNDAVLAELKKISAWADMQRKTTKWSLIFVAVFLPLMIVFSFVMDNRMKSSLQDLRNPPEELTWYDVDRNVCLGDLNKAVELGEKLIEKTPLYPDGHRRLAAAYLAAGQIEKAKQHYQEAHRLFPSKENQAALEAVEQRIKEQSPQPGIGR